MIVKEKDIASDPVKKLSLINKKVENETEKLYKIIGNRTLSVQFCKDFLS